ncbi:MAG TPA: hypothetical protein DCP98_10055 [Sphaerochaeta sp.]|jgi:AcrR family transcriptional regulator|nr:hypothetical protein [Sphaerochaeta sp.]
MSNTRQQIMDALLDLGAEKGLSNVSLSDIADKVGIRKASIYSHFESQKAMTESMVEYCQGILQTKSFKVDFKAKDAQSLMEALVDSFLETFAEKPLSSYLSIVQQQRMFDPYFAQQSKKLNSMIGARVRVALEYCVQRSWLDIKDTDVASDFFTSAVMDCLCDVIVGTSDYDWELDRLVDGVLTLYS